MKIQIENSAGGIVYKKEGNNYLWLVVQHSGKMHWGFPKGHIGDKNKNEDMKDAALREVQEEGGIKAKIISANPIVTNYIYRSGDVLHKKTVSYFLMEYVSGDPKNHDWEISETKIIPEKEVLDTLTFKGDKDAFEQATQKINGSKID